DKHPAPIHCQVRRSSICAMRCAARKQQYAPYPEAHSEQRRVTRAMVGRSRGGKAYSSRIPANDTAAVMASRRAGRLRGITQDSGSNLTALCFAANEPSRLDTQRRTLAHGVERAP